MFMINQEVKELLKRESAFYNSRIHGITHWGGYGDGGYGDGVVFVLF
jgi:hypothetical protein